MEVYPDQSNVTMDMINKFVKAMYAMRKEARKKVFLF